ncbi:hypothetical protein ACVIWU_005844 [Bradyrhizobium sp. USDA 4509]|nr:hypothetical protein [Bradyrhizobium elkanii]
MHQSDRRLHSCCFGKICASAASKELCISCGYCFYARSLAAPQYPMVNFEFRGKTSRSWKVG